MKLLKDKQSASATLRPNDSLHFITSVPLFGGKVKARHDMLGGLAVIGLSLGTVLLMRILLAR